MGSKMPNQNKLNKLNFKPDPDFKTYFPWSNVIACFEEALPSCNFQDNDPCPKCKKNSENLVWINFVSPDWTWKKKCGREGPLSICPDCKIQVAFLCIIMNQFAYYLKTYYLSMRLHNYFILKHGVNNLQNTFLFRNWVIYIANKS